MKQYIYLDKNTIAQKLAALTGSGTPGRLAKWTSPSGLGDSSIGEDKNGVVSVAHGIRFPDGTIQTSAGTESHFKQIRFSLPLNQQYDLDLPVKDAPVRVEFAALNVNEAYSGSQLYLYPALGGSAILTQDSATGYYGIVNLVSSRDEAELILRIQADLDPTKQYAYTRVFIATARTQYVQSDHLDMVVNLWY